MEPAATKQPAVSVAAPASPVADGAEFWREDVTDRDLSALRVAFAKIDRSDVDPARYRLRLRARDGRTFVSFAHSDRMGEPRLVLLPVEQAAARLAHEGSFDSGKAFELESQREYQRLMREQADAGRRERQERARQQERLEKWFARSTGARGLYRVAAAQPQFADLLCAMARAIDAEPRQATRDQYDRITDNVPDAALDLAAK